MFILKLRSQTNHLIAKYAQILLYGLVVLIVSLLTNNSQINVWANNQPNSNNCGDNLVQLISFCQKDSDTGNFVFGYNNFEQCNQKCLAQKENWDNWTYVHCALACENTTSRPNLKQDKRFRASAYNQCVDQLFESNKITRNELICACNNNERFLQTAPVRCLDFVERPQKNSQISNILLNLLPECFNLDIYAPNIVACAKSIVNILLVTGIIFLGVSLGYLAAQSLLSGQGNFWEILKEKTRDLIVGILLIGTPMAILNLIDPRSQFLDFSNFVELSLGKRLRDPTGKDDTICEGDPNSTGVVYRYTIENDKSCDGPWGTPCDYNIKFPTLAFYNCKIFFGASRHGSHLTGYFPIFDVENIKIEFDEVPRGRNRIDYAGPRVAAGENGVGIISVDSFTRNEWSIHTRFWDGESETYKDREYEIFTNKYFLSVARVAYYKGNWIAIAPIEKQYKVANLGPDLRNKGSPIQWKTFESDQVTYAGYAELITNRDFTELYAIFGARGDNSKIITIMQYKETTNNEATGTFEKIAEINTSDTNVGVCHRPSGALDSQGNLHFTCDDTDGSLYYYTNAEGSWKKQLLTDNGFNGVLRIDQKDGIHAGFITYRSWSPAYMYSSDGNTWTRPIVANEIVNPKYGFTANMIGGVAIHEQNPYLLVAFEDWTNTGGRVGLIMFGAET